MVVMPRDLQRELGSVEHLADKPSQSRRRRWGRLCCGFGASRSWTLSSSVQGKRKSAGPSDVAVALPRLRSLVQSADLRASAKMHRNAARRLAGRRLSRPNRPTALRSLATAQGACNLSAVLCEVLPDAAPS